MIAFGAQITNQRFLIINMPLKSKDKVKYTKNVLHLVTQTPLSFFLMEVVHIWHHLCFSCVDYSKVSNNKYDLGVKGQGHIYSKSIFMVCNLSSSSFLGSMFKFS